MFIIIAYSGKSKWVSGIFKEEEDALEYLNLIPEDLKEYQNLIKLEEIDFPFFVVEKDGFQFVDRDEMIRALNCIKLSQDEDEVYFNIYTIESDYKPKKPGIDYMGILKHDHITNDFMDWYKKEGIDFLVRRGICK